MRQDSRLELVTVDAVLRALVVVYERQLTAYGAEVRQDAGRRVGRREDGADERSAMQRRSRPRRRTDEDEEADQAGGGPIRPAGSLAG